MSNIEGQLRSAVIACELSIKAIADQSGVHYASVYHFVKSGTAITLRTAAKLAKFLKLELRPIQIKRKR